MEAACESSSCPVTAMEAVCELFACPVTATEAAYELLSCSELAEEALSELLPCLELATEAALELLSYSELAEEAISELSPCSEPAMVDDCELFVRLVSSNVSDFELSVLPVSVNESKPELSACLTHWSRPYRRRYQLSFFKISAKDTKNTLLILVTQISVIHQSKLLSVYFYLRTLTITTKLCGFGKKRENKQGALCLLRLCELLLEIRH